MTVPRECDELRGRVGTIAALNGTSPPIENLGLQWRTDRSLYERAEKRNDTDPYDDTHERFESDAPGRLTEARMFSATSGIYFRTQTYAFDGFGNLQTKDSNFYGDPTTTGYSYLMTGPSPYRLDNATIDGVMTWFQDDANGNITQTSLRGFRAGSEQSEHARKSVFHRANALPARCETRIQPDFYVPGVPDVVVAMTDFFDAPLSEFEGYQS